MSRQIDWMARTDMAMAESDMDRHERTVMTEPVKVELELGDQWDGGYGGDKGRLGG